MKYWNKQKEVRLRCWTCIQLQKEKSIWIKDYPGWSWLTEYDNLKIELQRSPSKSRFYMRHTIKEIWFESAKDATWFALKYSELL
jgi:hypothetical protein